MKIKFILILMLVTAALPISGCGLRKTYTNSVEYEFEGKILSYDAQSDIITVVPVWIEDRYYYNYDYNDYEYDYYYDQYWEYDSALDIKYSEHNKELKLGNISEETKTEISQSEFLQSAVYGFEMQNGELINMTFLYTYE